MKNNNLKKESRGWHLFTASLSTFILAGFVSTAQVLTPSTTAASTSASIACGTSTVLMDHAGNNNYANNANGYVVIYASAGAQINLNGSYSTESGYDYVRIYDGVGTGGTLLTTLTGAGTFNQTYNFGQTITVRFSSDASNVSTGFNFNVTYSGICSYTSCSTAPTNYSVVPNITTICQVYGNTVNLTVPNTLSLSALSFSWQSSTQGALGPYSDIPNANGVTGTQHIIGVTQTVTIPTWYQVVMTCTVGGPSTTISPVQIQITPTTTNTVPYFEGFEGIAANDQFPNCSWNKSDVVQCGTRTVTINAWRQARTGNSYAEFDGSNGNTNTTRYYYTNGIQLNAGITYSASLWYANSGANNNWQNLRMSVGPNQSTTGLVSIANVFPGNINYQALTNTFTVSSSGIYYVAVSAINSGGNSQLVWDDLSITIPCQHPGNTLPLSFNGAQTICQGQTVTISATGANTYSWSNGATGNAIQISPMTNTNYTVSGTSTVSGCQGTAIHQLVVNPAPPVSIVSLQQAICSGKSATLIASGANSYSWSTGSNAVMISVSPTSGNTTYSVIGSNATGCQSTATTQILVNPSPIVSATGQTLICNGHNAVLTANGAGQGGSYEWLSGVMYFGNTVVLSPTVTTTYLLKGTDANGCEGVAQVAVAVDPCTGIQEAGAGQGLMAVYPNPNDGVFTVAGSENGTKKIEVMDMTGRIVLSEAAAGSAVQVNITGLSKGVYYVKISTETASQVVKVVKN